MIQYRKLTFHALILGLLGLAYLPLPAFAFTLSLFGSSTPALGWQVNRLSFDIDYTNCPSQDKVNQAVDTAVNLWNSAPNSSLVISRGSTVTATVAEVISTSHAAGNPVIVCDPNFATTIGVSGIEEISPGVSINGRAYSTGKIAFYAILLNAQTGAKANISNFDSTLTALILAHEMGHVLGLGHSPDKSALMYYNASEKTQLNLAKDDLDGLAYLYPRNELGGSGGVFGCGSLRNISKNDSGPDDPSHPSNGARTLLEWMAFFLFCFLAKQVLGKIPSIKTSLE